MPSLEDHNSDDDDELSSTDKHGRPGDLTPATCSSGSTNDEIVFPMCMHVVKQKVVGSNKLNSN